MKKFFNKNIISLFICICMIACVMPMTAFAQNTEKTTSSSQTSQTESKAEKEQEKEIKKIELSLGSSYKKVYDRKEVSKSDVYALVSSKSGGASIFTYKWYDANGNRMESNPVNAGVYKLYIKVSEEDPSYTGSATVTYIIEQRPLEWDISGLKISKPYDGTNQAAKIKGYLEIKGVVEGDDAALAYDSIKAADFPTADVQTVSVPISVENAGITGTSRDNYSLPKIAPTAEASIKKAYITEIVIEGDNNKYRQVAEEAVYVTESLAKTEYSTEENIKTALRTKIAEDFGEKEFNIVYYTTYLQVFENDEWVDVSADKMPQYNAEFTLPYPEGTAENSHEFVVYRMKTNGDNAGEIEVWISTEKVEGIETSLSQGDILAVGYTAAKTPNITMIIIIAAVAVMIISGVVFLKLRKADKEDGEEQPEN